MKKVFSIVLTLALAVTAFATVASAADSPEKVTGVITAASSSGATVTVRNTTTADSVFEGALNSLKGSNPALKIIDKKTLAVSSGATYPLSVDFTVSGLNASGKVYLLLKKADGTVATIEAAVNGNRLTASIPEAGEIALVAATSGSSSTGTSPKTADTAAPVALAVLALCAGAAFVSAKKIKA